MKYSTTYDKESQAVAQGRSLPVSTKACVNICAMLRKKNLARAKVMLQKVIAKKEAVPYKRYNKDVGHKPGPIGAGRYPVKACKYILKVLNSAEANAKDKGLSKELVIEHINAHIAARQFKHGRQRRRQNKRTHVEVLLAQTTKKTVEKKVEVQKKSEPAKKVEEVPKASDLAKKAVEQKETVKETKEPLKVEKVDKK